MQGDCLARLSGPFGTPPHTRTSSETPTSGEARARVARAAAAPRGAHKDNARAAAAAAAARAALSPIARLGFIRIALPRDIRPPAVLSPPAPSLLCPLGAAAPAQLLEWLTRPIESATDSN